MNWAAEREGSASRGRGACRGPAAQWKVAQPGLGADQGPQRVGGGAPPGRCPSPFSQFSGPFFLLTLTAARPKWVNPICFAAQETELLRDRVRLTSPEGLGARRPGLTRGPEELGSAQPGVPLSGRRGWGRTSRPDGPNFPTWCFQHVPDPLGDKEGGRGGLSPSGGQGQCWGPERGRARAVTSFPPECGSSLYIRVAPGGCGGYGAPEEGSQCGGTQWGSWSGWLGSADPLTGPLCPGV